VHSVTLCKCLSLARSPIVDRSALKNVGFRAAALADLQSLDAPERSERQLPWLLDVCVRACKDADGVPESEVFFGYPSRPQALRDTIAAAAARIDSVGGVRSLPWENLQVGGRLVIDQILEAIGRSNAGLYEVTDLNENVLFELGFAVGSGRIVWLLRDPSFEDAGRRWERLRLLSTIGYQPYQTSDDIFAAFLNERPDLRAGGLFSESIEPALHAGSTPSIFYLTGLYNSDAGSSLTRVIRSEAKKGVRLTIADPNETAVQPLLWYAQQIHDAAAVVVHFESPARLDSDTHNGRCAFIAGFVHGMGKPLLMLAIEDYSSPFDYRDLLYVYRTAADCSTRAAYWLQRELQDLQRLPILIAHERARRELATELRNLRLGEPVAENEAEALDEYFIDTSAFGEALSNRSAVFVGKRGAGKTATVLEAARQLALDRRNLVCTIRPTGYQLEGLARLLNSFTERDTRSFSTSTVWEFLLYSELARAAVAQLSERPAGVQPSEPEWDLAMYLEKEGSDLREDFDVRVERAVLSLRDKAIGSTLEEERSSIAGALHRNRLGRLRQLLTGAVAQWDRIAILVDDLDKAWDSESDMGDLSHLLLGLLTSVQAITNDLRPSTRVAGPQVTLAVFIRTDIFGHLLAIAREPDKIPVYRLVWPEPSRLVAVINERYVAGADRDVRDEELWERFFCREVRGLETRDYIVRRVLPRPRDIIVFCSAAIDAAIVRQSSIVDVEDILEADKFYSQFAFEAIRVEDPSLVGKLEDALLEFAGGPAVVSDDEIRDVLRRGGLLENQQDAAIHQLRDLWFLGIEVEEGGFSFDDDPRAKKRDDVRARRLGEMRGAPPRYEVHRAFRPYLEIRDS
jgi:hypothetical protein